MTELAVPPNVESIAVDFSSVRFFTHQDVQPFTYRSGISYTALLETIRKWLGETLVPQVNGNFTSLSQGWQDNAAEISAAIDAAIAAETTTVQAALDAQHTDVQAALDAQETTVSQQLAQAVEALAGGSVTVIDPGVAGMLQDTSSQTRGVLDGLYAAKTVVDGISTLVNTGRLTQAALDAAYTVTDAQVAAFASNASSQTRAAFAAAFSQIQMQVAGGYIQFKRTSDPTWTNLVATADLVGPRGLEGEQGNPGGAAELDYAEIVSNVDVAPGSAFIPVAGLTLSVTMPARPVMLKIGGIARFVSTSGFDGTFQIVETTGGGSTVVAEAHTGYSSNSSDYQQVLGERRITGTAGQVRTFKLQVRQVTGVTWSIIAAQAYPFWIAAHEC